jgi:hypothetical protein
MTLDEARAYLKLKGGVLKKDEDQWVAVGTSDKDKDWIQIGSKPHSAGKSHRHDLGGYPHWGDDNKET